MRRAYMGRAHCDRQLAVEAGEAALVLGDELRVEGRQPVARNLQIQLAGAGEHGFAAIAVAAVGAPVRLAAIEMVVELGIQRPLGERLLEPVQQAALGQGRSGIRPAQELVQHLIRDRGLFASWHTMAPSAASYGPKHEIPDSPPRGRAARGPGARPRSLRSWTTRPKAAPAGRSATRPARGRRKRR